MVPNEFFLDERKYVKYVHAWLEAVKNFIHCMTVYTLSLYCEKSF